MKINLFGRKYYTVNNNEYKRSNWVAFKCFIEWDVVDKITGKHYMPDGNGGLEKRYFNWYRKRKDPNYGIIWNT